MQYHKQFYIMNADGEIVEAESREAWQHFLDNNKINVGLALVGEVVISTAFVGIPQRSDHDGRPKVFSSVIVGGPRGGDSFAYATWEEAERGHARRVEEAERLESIAEQARTS